MIKGNSLSVDVDILISYLNKTDLNYLEIGCFDGVNLVKLALHYPNIKIYGIDPFISDGHTGTSINTHLSKQQENLYSNIANIDNIKFFQLTSEQFSELEINYSKLNIGCIFIDGSHHYNDVMIDIDIAVKCIQSNKNKKGIIIFHDINIPDVINAIVEFINKLQLNKILYNLITTPDFNIFEIDYTQ